MQESFFRTLVRRLIDSVLHPVALSGQWSDVENRAHTHATADVIGLQSLLDTTVAGVNSSISTLSSSVDTRITTLSTTVTGQLASTTTYVNTQLATTVANVNTSIANLTAAVNTKNDTQDGLITGLRTDVNTNTAGLSTLNAKVAAGFNEDDALFYFYLGR